MEDTKGPAGAMDNGSPLQVDQPKPVLRSIAHRRFMDHLLSGQLKPGLLVSQRELCESTGSSIGAMREALKRLEAEGIVLLIPQRGVKVREPSEKEINDVYETRKIVEPHATRVYAQKGDLDSIADIKRQTQEILERKAVSREQAAKLFRERILVDDLLHQTILAVLGNHSIDDIFEKLRVQIQVSRLSVQPRYVDSRPAAREHLVIIEALERRDGDAAAAAMTDHLEKGRLRALGFD